MFESLKKKLSGLVDKLTKKVDEKVERELKQVRPEVAEKAPELVVEAPERFEVPEAVAPPQGEMRMPEPPLEAPPKPEQPGPEYPKKADEVPKIGLSGTEPPLKSAEEPAEPGVLPEPPRPKEPSPGSPPPEPSSFQEAVPKPPQQEPSSFQEALPKRSSVQQDRKPATLFGSLAEKTRSLKDRLSILKRKTEAEGLIEKEIPVVPKPEGTRVVEEKKPAPSVVQRLDTPVEAPKKPVLELEQPKAVPSEKPAPKAGLVELPEKPVSEQPKVKPVELPERPLSGPGLPKASPVETPKKQAPDHEKQRSIKDRLFGAILETEISDSDLDEILSGFEVDLLENDVALEVTEKIVSDMRGSLKGRRVKRSGIEKAIRDSIRFSLEDVLSKGKSIDLLGEIRKADKPYKLVFVGINGTGKTTTIAKIANLCLRNGFEPVIAASDTFRAASIEQLEVHANRLGVKLVKHKYGADAAAVAYDAIEHAKAKAKPVVLIDTAGRMQTNANLMDELRKIIRVVDPNLVVFVGDSLTGNDAVEQARTFNEVRVDAVILTKSDADAKGGACLSISYAIGKPVLYLGTGQNYSDLVKFTPEWFMEKVGVA